MIVKSNGTTFSHAIMNKNYPFMGKKNAILEDLHRWKQITNSFKELTTY